MDIARGSLVAEGAYLPSGHGVSKEHSKGPSSLFDRSNRDALVESCAVMMSVEICWMGSAGATCGF
jgi:hypothetical protein